MTEEQKDSGISFDDLRNMHQLLAIAAKRGTWEAGNEQAVAGQVFLKLTTFLEAIAADQAAKQEAEQEAEAAPESGE